MTDRMGADQGSAHDAEMLTGSNQVSPAKRPNTSASAGEAALTWKETLPSFATGTVVGTVQSDGGVFKLPVVRVTVDGNAVPGSGTRSMYPRTVTVEPAVVVMRSGVHTTPWPLASELVVSSAAVAACAPEAAALTEP